MPVSLRRALRAIPALLIVLLIGTACVDSLAPDTTINRVTLTPVSASLGLGATRQLTATARNRRSDPIADVPFTFLSEQPSIASVDANGLVTALSVGVATIRATTGTFSATSTITVQVPVCSNATATNTITTSQSTTGTLTASDCLFNALTPSDGYQFVASGPTTVLFTLTGDSIRPKLTLTGATMATVLADRQGETIGDTIRLYVNVTAGTYNLWVRTDPSFFGSYTLTSRPAVECTFNDALPALGIGETFEGALGASSCLLPNGAEAAGRSISVTAETEIRYDVKANGFTPRIFLTDRSLNIFSLSVPATADSAVLQDVIPVGDYHVWVSSNEGGQGSFSLTRSVAVFDYCDVPTDTIEVPGSISGSLGLGDCVLEPGFFADPVLMEVTAPTALRIDLLSSDFDAYLAIADSTDTIVVADDDGGLGTNSRISLNFPRGRYTLLPMSYSANEYGSYTLIVDLAAAIESGSVRLTPKPRTRTRSWDELATKAPHR